MDRGGGGPAPRSTDAMLDTVRTADAVLVSDYGRGLAACPRMREVLESSRVPVVWDPHPLGPPPVPGVSLATPNLPEALAFAGTDGPEAAAVLRERWRAAAVAVTTGARGAVLDRGAGPEPVPAPVVDARDTCGAGDRFAVAAAAALMDGADAREAVAAAVEAASRFLARGGLSAAQPERTPEGLIAAVRAAAARSSPPAAASTWCTPGTPRPSPRRGPSATAWWCA
ncbi:PfkB family carbohydrate kinase [Actinokineospora soli]|uniref:PfkB family carbohydrate kinase n=1 Tax=Actinokineospora soli TaxID=1048753 RepID=A0ABW2TMI2_9PSEU